MMAEYKTLNFDDSLEYRIIEFKGKDIYAYKTPTANNRQQFLSNILEIYENLKKQNIFKKIMSIGMFGITDNKSEDNQIYYVGSEHKFDNTEKIKILPGTYAVFNCNGDDQIHIAPLVDKIYKYDFICPDLKIDKKYCFEEYIDDTCFLYIKVTNMK